jgi:hypothetical protein
VISRLVGTASRQGFSEDNLKNLANEIDGGGGDL